MLNATLQTKKLHTCSGVRNKILMFENGRGNPAKKEPAALKRSETEKLAQRCSTVRDRIALFDKASISYNPSKSENPKSTGSDSNNNEVVERRRQVKTPIGKCEDTRRKQIKSECPAEADASGKEPRENSKRADKQKSKKPSSERSEKHRRNRTSVAKKPNKYDSELYQCYERVTQSALQTFRELDRFLQRINTTKVAGMVKSIDNDVTLVSKAVQTNHMGEEKKETTTDATIDDGVTSEEPAAVVEEENGETVIVGEVRSEERLTVDGDLEVSNANTPETTTHREKDEEDNRLQEDDDDYGFQVPSFETDFVEAYNRNGGEVVIAYVEPEFHEVCEDQVSKASSAEGLRTINIGRGISLILSEDDDNYDDDGYENQCNYKTARRETYFDENSNPRIEKISTLNSYDVQAPGKLVASLSVPPSPLGIKNKIDYIIEELLMTEGKYVEDLRKIKKDYIAYLSDDNLLDHPAIIGKQCYLFGNIEEILAYSEDFLAALRGCGGNYELISETFVAYTIMFELYPNYSKNKLRADQYYKSFKTLINKRQKELGERLDLASYLLTPIQRLGKYILLLENMQKELRRQDVVSENLDSAIAIVKGAMRRGNDSIAVDSIKNCPISLIEQAGSFIMREKFAILKPRKFESVVFLFEEMVVFTEVLPRSIHFFSYVEHIFLKDLTIVTFEQEALMFHLVDYIKCKKHENREQNTHVLEAKSLKVKQTFTSQIEIRLWEQLHEVKEKVNELHSKEGRRYSTQEINGQKKDQASDSLRKNSEKIKKKACDKTGQSTFYV